MPSTVRLRYCILNLGEIIAKNPVFSGTFLMICLVHTLCNRSKRDVETGKEEIHL